MSLLYKFVLSNIFLYRIPHIWGVILKAEVGAIDKNRTSTLLGVVDPLDVELEEHQCGYKIMADHHLHRPDNWHPCVMPQPLRVHLLLFMHSS